MHGGTLTLRIIGFVLCLILTLATYFIITQPEYFDLKAKMAIVVILTLAVIQSMVQLIFFLNIWREKGAYWNLGVFISTVSIILVIVVFSIWIMDTLNYNMMPPQVE